MTAVTVASNTRTAGHTAKENPRMNGESRRLTRSALRSANTFGISSPKMIVTTVSGSTTRPIARISAVRSR